MIQREFLTLDIGALGKLDKGRVGTLFAAAMEQVIDGLHDDESDRSKGWAKGAIASRSDWRVVTPRTAVTSTRPSASRPNCPRPPPRARRSPSSVAPSPSMRPPMRRSRFPSPCPPSRSSL